MQTSQVMKSLLVLRMLMDIDLLQLPAYVTRSIEFIYHQDGVKVRIQKKMSHFRNKVL